MLGIELEWDAKQTKACLKGERQQAKEVLFTIMLG